MSLPGKSNGNSRKLKSSKSSSNLLGVGKRSGPETPSASGESISTTQSSSSLFGDIGNERPEKKLLEKLPLEDPQKSQRSTTTKTADKEEVHPHPSKIPRKGTIIHPTPTPASLAPAAADEYASRIVSDLEKSMGIFLNGPILKYEPVIEKVKRFNYIKIKNIDSMKSADAISIVKEKITFDWKNTNLAFVNTFRRVLISEIETLVLGNFKFHNFLPTNSLQGCRPLDMSRLQPVMHNEQLSLALELIPISQDIYQENYIRQYLISQELPKETFSFENIRVCLGINKTPDEKLAEINPEGYKNKDKPIEDIHTDKLKIYIISSVNQRVVGEIPNELFFPNKVLITKLKKDQTIGFCCSLIQGTGSSNSKFTPVCSASFHYDEPEPEVLQSDYKMTYETPDPPFSHRLVTTFHFLVHSLPYWTPEHVLFRGLSSFNRVIDRFLLQLKEIITSKKFELEIIDGNTSLAFTLENENYTIGNIIQNYLAEPTMMEAYPSELPKVVFAGFIIEHPKIKKMKCRVTVEGTEEDSVFAVIDHVVKQIKKQINKTETAFKKAFA
jgi:DNA-directed RNA polymerase alpha subunit/DNA-directed RNA polymerase subunit L